MSSPAQPAKTEKEKTDLEYYREAFEVVQSVVRRGAILVQRYAQYIANDLNDRRLKIELRTSIWEIDEGVCLVVEFITSKNHILEAVKSPKFRKLIKRYEKEFRKMKRSGKSGS